MAAFAVAHARESLHVYRQVKDKLRQERTKLLPRRKARHHGKGRHPIKTKDRLGRRRANGGIGEGCCTLAFQAGTGTGNVAPAERHNHRRGYESDGLAATLGARLLCRSGQEEAEVESSLAQS
jgi:hypothetical protein